MKSIRATNIPKYAARIGARVPSDTVNSKLLAANTAERDTIPSGAGLVVINSSADIYVKAGSASVDAAVATDVTDGSGSALNPAVYILDGTHVAISVISESACKVTFEYYKLV